MVRNLQDTLSTLAVDFSKFALQAQPETLADEVLLTVRRAIELATPYINEEDLAETEKTTPTWPIMGVSSCLASRL